MSKGKKGTRASSGMGSIRQRADGRWEARYTSPDKHQRSVYGKTEKEVTAKLRAALHELDTGIWREPSRITVNDWMDIWLKDYQGHTTGRTVIAYTSYVDNYIKPVIGKIKLVNLKPVHVMHILSEMQKRDLSPATQRQTCMVMGSAMRAAITAGIIKDNPTSGVRLPKRKNTILQIVDRQHIPLFIEAVKNTKFPYELLFMLYTGLRVGELRGLRWVDIDMDAGVMKVERQLYTHAHSTGFGLPKYGEVRTIVLADEALDVLRNQRKRQAEQRLAAGVNWIENDISADLVFRQSKGQAHTNSSLERVTKEVGAAIGLPGLHPHDLRHSYAVAALRAGADIKTVQNNMGHKSASVTLDTYAAYTTDAGKVSARKLSDYLKNDR